MVLAALAFDRARILDDGIERARGRLEYTTLATHFCGETFTIAELRAVYEAVWGVELDAANFHRNVMATAGFVEETEETVAVGNGRPARAYRKGEADALHPPLRSQSARTPP